MTGLAGWVGGRCQKRITPTSLGQHRERGHHALAALRTSSESVRTQGKDTICRNDRGNRVPLKKVPRTMTLRRGHPVVARGAHNNPAQWRRVSVDFSLQWEDFIMHPVDPLILDESPERAGAIAVIDAPGLVTAALERSGDVRVWCDDLRDAQAVSEIDPGLLVSHPGELRGVDLVWGHLPKSLAALDEHCASVQGAPDVMFLSGARVKHTL